MGASSNKFTSQAELIACPMLIKEDKVRPIQCLMHNTQCMCENIQTEVLRPRTPKLFRFVYYNFSCHQFYTLGGKVFLPENLKKMD